jgi:S1-C subfamily serine protease
VCGAPAVPAAAPASAVFVIVTVDRTTWEPYEYGSAFFYDREGDAYTASHVVADAVTHPDLRLVAIVGGVEYIARALCWNPASPDRTNTYNRDVAVVHVGPEVPQFPIGPYPPAARALKGASPAPLAVRRGAVPAVGQIVQVAGFGERQAGPVFFERTRQGRVVRIERTPDGTAIARMQFPAGAGPVSGDSGGPVFDSQHVVVGMADWIRTHPLTPGTVEMDGITAGALGCVERVPAALNRLDPSNTPLRLP